MAPLAGSKKRKPFHQAVTRPLPFCLSVMLPGSSGVSQFSVLPLAG